MQNLSEGLLKAVRKVTETAELKLKLCTHTRILNEIEVLCMQWQAEMKAKQQLAFTVNQVFTMKSFADAIIIINKDRENQILDLQQKIEYLYRQMTISNLKVSSQSFIISSKVYTLSEITAQNENLSMEYIKSEDLLKLLSFNSD
ncbi:uncharacterized protein BDCG_17541 [Blastomyces dermatitidis ER-3]|uniref:Uncharacterized protein n=1 Tax=Ajellomyces dermatitidis (strain ER-3 / ATCC MYA-2586) TaxID=559297 RepID=A0ABX2VZ64_AJEDR|nr:uncharacterized protein BDCG_17541 [Blastomyces dermatitidis ER-3]OAT02422.1 hypothetical protein BDCG_17541 [Blastomyces dermatitidis ER-3]